MPRRAEQTLRKSQQSGRYELDRVRVDCTCGWAAEGAPEWA